MKKTHHVLCFSTAIGALLGTTVANAQLECGWVMDSEIGYGVAECGGSLDPYLAGGGFVASTGANFVGPEGGFAATQYAMECTDPNKRGYAYGACCNELAGPGSYVYSNTDTAIASCGSHIAVGGGGYCEDSDAKIVYSHPMPYQTNSTPHEWRIKCSKGKAVAFANCSAGTTEYDTCRVQRTISSGTRHATATCNSNEVTVSAGGWCGGSGAYLQGAVMYSSLDETYASCSKNNTHAFAVCCDGDVQ